MRVGFIGASGTGKSTLVRFLQTQHPDVPVNPVGSRSVAKAMGFVHPEGSLQAGEGNPYAVDHASASIYEMTLGILNNLSPLVHPDAFPSGMSVSEALAVVARDAAVEAADAWKDGWNRVERDAALCSDLPPARRPLEERPASGGQAISHEMPRTALPSRVQRRIHGHQDEPERGRLFQQEDLRGTTIRRGAGKPSAGCGRHPPSGMRRGPPET